MTKFLLVIFMSLSLLSGCKSIENQQDQIHLSNKETSHTVSMESENSYLENSQYNYTSLNEYSDEIGNGTTLTIPELKLTKDSLAITFEMTFSSEIYEKIAETEKPLYVAITELNQEAQFIDILDEVHPPYYEVITTIEEDKKVDVTLNFDLLRQPTATEKKELLTPSNYQLVFLNEELEIVAVYIY